MTKPDELFHELGGLEDDGFYEIPSYPLLTERDTRYFRAPGVALFGKPSVNMRILKNFLDGFPEDLGFRDYINDPAPLTPGAQLCKFFGQLCYMSLGRNRTMNKDAAKYFKNIESQGHGSVLEHANFSFLLYGIPRSTTHEMVRHRAGFAYSQVSQRYVSGKVLRFVEKVEYYAWHTLHALFQTRIDATREEYDKTADLLLALQDSGIKILGAGSRTGLRKKVRQVARSILPNETEAPIGVSGNIRAWRHFVEMRGGFHINDDGSREGDADTEIRELALRIFLCLQMTEPILFSNYQIVELVDGTYGIQAHSRKV